MQINANRKKSDIISSISNLVLLIVMVTINALAVILPLNDQTTKEISDNYPILFTPSGITFSIWGLIYLLLFVYISYQIYLAFYGNKKFEIHYLDHLLFAVTCLLNSIWIFAWHYDLIILSVFIMILLLLTLIWLNERIEKLNLRQTKEIFAIKIPINIYLGWISVASIANIGAMLNKFNWNGFGISENVWVIILIGLATIIAAIMLIKKNSFSYSMVIVWAFIGIIIERSSQSIILYDILYTTYFAILIILILLAIYMIKNIQRMKKFKSGI